MAAPETRVMVNLLSRREVMDQVKVDVLRLVSEKVLEFQEEQVYLIWQAVAKGEGYPFWWLV